MSSAETNLIIGVLVLALLLWRQLVTRRLSESYRLSIILAIIGIVQFADFLNGHPSDHGGIAVAVVGSLVIAAVFGAVRALTVRVWRDESGQLLRKGTWLTAVLWVLSLAAHLGYDDLVAGHITGKNGGNVGDATVLLYLVVTLTIQRFVLLRRVELSPPGGTTPSTPRGADTRA
jgi:hypothetical protein